MDPVFYSLGAIHTPLLLAASRRLIFIVEEDISVSDPTGLLPSTVSASA